MHTCAYKYMHMHAYMNIHTQTHITHAQVHTHTYILSHTSTCVYIYAIIWINEVHMFSYLMKVKYNLDADKFFYLLKEMFTY